MTWRELLEQGQKTLREASVPEAETDAWYLLEYVSHRDRGTYFLHCQETVSDEEAKRFLELVERRKSRIPLQHLTGVQEFMGLTFQVNDYVLVPRQDTEILVEKLLPLVKGKKVLDVCTGSGCIAISLDKLGKAGQVDGVDLSGEALKVAEKNAGDLASGVRLWQSDLFEKVTQQYHVIVSNPPYIPTGVIGTLMPEVREHEPVMALDGGRDGLDFYRKIIAGSGEHLLSGGILAVEIGHNQGERVAALFRQYHFCRVECYQDYGGNDRVVMGEYKP